MGEKMVGAEALERDLALVLHDPFLHGIGRIIGRSTLGVVAYGLGGCSHHCGRPTGLLDPLLRLALGVLLLSI
jgi:hypothetical protein